MSDILLFTQLLYKQELSVPEKNGFHLLIFQFQNIYKPVATSTPKPLWNSSRLYNQDSEDYFVLL